MIEAVRPAFEKNRTYARKQIHAEFGGQYQYGISTPSGKEYIFLFTTPRGKEHGYEDGWISKDLYKYSGEGQLGDMTLTRGNKAIMNHINDRKDLHLFEQMGNGQVQYVGLMRYKSHQILNIDSKGSKRKVVVFFLEPL